MCEKYIDQIVTIIYQDRGGRITQRHIKVCEVADGRIKAYDCSRKAPRVFDVERILALRPSRCYVS